MTRLADAPARIGIIGCGAISSTYLAGLAMFTSVQVTACADLDRARADGLAASAGRRTRALGVDELLAAPDIDVVLNLTVPGAHAAVTAMALEAGKDVYVEKPLALHRDEGRRVLDRASRLGLLVGAAPDTFLSPALQTCRRVIDDGAIGQPVSAVAEWLSPGHESWHPDPAFYYRAGGGPLFDMGPYYLTALVSLLGPIGRVSASAVTTRARRTITSAPRADEVIDVEVPTHVGAVIDFAGGPVATLTMSFDVGQPSWALTIHGSEGSLRCPDPNTFDGPVQLHSAGTQGWRDVADLGTRGARRRGFGLVDMTQARAERRSPRAGGELALHVLDAMQACHESSTRGCSVALTTTCARPAPLDT